jgi:uncharacterized membrane protein
MTLRTFAVMGTVALLGAAAFGQQYGNLTWLENITPTGVSNNGVVCGSGPGRSTQSTRALVWEENAGLVELPFADTGTLCTTNFAHAISSDGKVVVGGYAPPCGGRALWLKTSTGWTILSFPRFPGSGVDGTSSLRDIAKVGDDYYFVGAGTGPSYVALYRLSGSQIERLFLIDEYQFRDGGGGYPAGLSDMIVFNRRVSSVEFRGFSGNVITQRQFPTSVVDISTSGVVLGRTWYARTIDAPYYDLPIPVGASRIEAADITEDGNVIVGRAIFSDNTTRGVIWTWDSSIQTYVPYYLSANIKSVTAISADGTYIVGRAVNPQGVEEGYRMGRVCPADVNGDNVVDDADLLEVLFSFGQSCGG